MNRRIIIVDDSETERFIARSVFNRLETKAEILVFESATKALGFIHESMLNNVNMNTIILLDINMPVMDGFGFIDKLKELPEEVLSCYSIYMLTSSINESDREKAFSTSRVTDFITKPFNREKAMGIIQNLDRMVQPAGK